VRSQWPSLPASMVRAAPWSCHLHLFPARFGSRGAVAHEHRTHACDASALSPPHVSRQSQSRACVRARARARRALQWLARRRRTAPPEWHRRRVAGRAAVPLGIHSHQLRVSVSGAQRCHCAAPRRRGTPSREIPGGTRAHIHGAAPWRLFSSIRAICSGVKGGAAAAFARGHPGCCRTARAAGARAPSGPVIAPAPEAAAPCGGSEKWWC